MKKNILSIGLLIILLLSTLSPIVFSNQLKNYNVLKTIKQEQTEKLNGPPIESTWPMYCHDARHTGRSPYGKVGNYRALRWKCRIKQLPLSSMSMDENGTIYIGSGDWELLSIYSNGTIKWQYNTKGHVQSTPAIGIDDTIYFGSDDGNLYALYPNGTIKWKRQVGDGWVYSSPVIDTNGIIYVASVNGKNIKAFYPNGTVKWNFKTDGLIYDSPALDENGILYIGSRDSYLYAIFKENGTLKWKYKTGYATGGVPTISDDGTIYFGSNDHYFYALYPNGTLKWRFSVGFDALTSSPALGIDGNIYFGCHAGYIYCLDTNGNEIWRYPTDAEVSGPISIDGNGIIYGGDWDGNFYALNPDGTARWKFKTGDYIMTSPAIGSDGTIYFNSWTGYLYALEIIEIDNKPPLKPSLEGPSEGKARKPLIFNATTTDPDGDNISYFFDWEYEYENSGWLDFVPSGTSISVEQTFYLVGTYTVKVKTQDEYGTESPWETMEIKITNSRPKISSFLCLLEHVPLLERLLGFIL